MSQSKKVTILAIVAVIISIFSLIISFISLNMVDARSGLAVLKADSFVVTLDSVKDFYITEDNTFWIKEPSLNNGEVNFGISLHEVNSKGQFSFIIANKSDVNAKLNDIIIEGLDNYKDYIDYSITGLSVGDEIEATKLYPCKFVITYKEAYVNEEGIINSINLDDVKIKFEFGK